MPRGSDAAPNRPRSRLITAYVTMSAIPRGFDEILDTFSSLGEACMIRHPTLGPKLHTTAGGQARPRLSPKFTYFCIAPCDKDAFAAPVPRAHFVGLQ